MMKDAELASYLERRNEVLRNLDVAGARQLNPKGAHLRDEVILVALHKARYDCTAIEQELRLQSAQWLRERGYQGMTGPLLAIGELPE